MVNLVLLLTAGATAAPVPAPSAPANTTVDRNQATQFAHMVYNSGQNIRGKYFGNVESKDLISGALRGLYEAAGATMPDDVLQAVKRAGDSSTDLLNVLIDCRVRLGNVPALSGPRAFVAAINGFKHAMDLYCGLASPRVNSVISVDMDFNIGIELEGVAGPRWSVYRIERSVAIGQLPPTGFFGPIPKPDAVPSPANFPWRIKRVIPGSPAQRAGVKPGDTITHLNGDEITAENANRMFVRFAEPVGSGFDPNTGQALPAKRAFKLKRPGTPASIELALETQQYTPEEVFGVMRTADGKWDCMLDRENKIGYIRLGPIEQGADEKLAGMLDDLTKRGCRALIFDLRWCPGGYVTPGTRIAGLFLKPNSVIAQVTKRNTQVPNGFSVLPEFYRAMAPFADRFPETPLLVLVGSETMGGGELIAAALQDNHRCAMMGQRTVGRASIQETADLGFGQLQFKVTTGATLRPNGKSRGRLPDSKPTDDWGIKPDAGLEVPITADLSAKLRFWADEQALRPVDSKEALPFDDPLKDPFRAAALAYLRKQLARKAVN
jgi:carboxyl-terminal processing protease